MAEGVGFILYGFGGGSASIILLCNNKGMCSSTRRV